jgi:energy-coupling factor transport system permease protein
MLKDITLGQFFPGESVVHRLDPRTKLVLTLVYIGALFTAKSYYSYALMVVVLVACVLLSEIKIKTILRSVKPLIIIILFTFVLNMLFTNGTHHVWQFWIINITLEGIEMAATMIIRLIMLIIGTFLLTYTTSPIALTDGLEKLMNPRRRRAARILIRGTLSAARRRCCRFWCRCSSVHSAGPMSWRLLWRAVVITAVKAERG